MNGRKAKAIRKKSLVLLVDWVKTLVQPEEAKKLIDESGLNVHSAVLLQEAADKVKEVLA